MSNLIMVKHVVIKSRMLRRARRFGRWQIVLSVLALLAVGATGFLYVQIRRAERREGAARAEFLSNQNRLRALKQRVAELEAKKSVDLPTPEAIRTSLVKFEEEVLSPGEETELTVVREINRLAERSGVDLSDINFEAIEQRIAEGRDTRGAPRRGGKSLFPGLEMSFTVEGSYADIRQFLLALENSQAFLIIDSLDLKSVEPSGSRGRSRPSLAAATNQIVALGIKLSVYYQREGL